MSNFSPTCTNKLTDAQKADLRWRWYWIAGREYYRVNAPDSVKAYDEIAAKSYPNYKFDDGNAALNTYLNNLGAGIKNWLPGWDDTACSFDQKAYACFAWTLAQSTPDQQASTLQLMAAGKDPGDFDCTGRDVASDPMYSTSFPGNQAGAGSASMWPWIIGLGAIGVVGAVIFFDRKKHGSKKGAASR